MPHFLILGCGFTGRRVGASLLALGHQVTCTHKDSFDVTGDWRRKFASFALAETVVLYSVPTVRTDAGLFEAAPQIAREMAANPPRRVVYLSTTGVYGATERVSELSVPAPRTERERLRVAAETAFLSGPWETLILRPAAIYGPGRGIHAAMRSGSFRLSGDGENFVSRIHVEDLARHAEAALLGTVTGAFPVADRLPCSSREAAEFCARLLNLPMPESAPAETLGETRQANRRVDGSAIRELLGIDLQFPSYREGFAACVEAEARINSEPSQ